MGSSSRHNNGYSREDLLSYISGQMPAAEMHALEKAALDDPLLADALDGLQLEEAGENKKHLASLDQRLAKRVDHKIIPMPALNWWRIAVAAALIGITGIVSYFILQINEDIPVIAQKTETLRVDSALVKADETQMPASEELSADKISGKSETQIEKLPKPMVSLEEKDKKVMEDKIKPALTTVAPIIAEQEEKKESEKIVSSSAAATKADLNDEAQANNAMRSAKQRPGIKEKMPGDYYFTGSVKDNLDKPVPFANIAIRNTQRTTYTDAKGNFRLVAGDSTLDVDIKSVGYNSLSLHLSYDQPNKAVILQPARPERAKKMAMPLEKAETDSVNPTLTEKDLVKPDAEPRDGFAAYQFYLLNNVRFPVDAKNNDKKGSVDVSFLVNENSRLSDFKIERSLSPANDKEAIRLIREGPPWVLYNSGKGIRAKITVTF